MDGYAAPARARIAARTGLPTGTPVTPSGRSAGQVPQASAWTRRANSWLTRPSTPFCSWIMRGTRSTQAAANAGIDG